MRGLLQLRRYELVAIDESGNASKPFPYDVLDRRALDATVMVAHFEEPSPGGEPSAGGRGGRIHVYLRTAVRPPVGLRRTEPFMSPVLWKLPAGLVEPNERPRAAAARELEEELGFSVPESSMIPLDGFTVPAPGCEVHHWFHVRVDPRTRRDPGGDGSPLEQGARIEAVPLDDALAACVSGEIRDAKTELALRRLVDTLKS